MTPKRKTPRLGRRSSSEVASSTWPLEKVPIWCTAVRAPKPGLGPSGDASRGPTWRARARLRRGGSFWLSLDGPRGGRVRRTERCRRFFCPECRYPELGATAGIDRSIAPGSHSGRVTPFAKSRARVVGGRVAQTIARASGGADHPRLGSHLPRRRAGPARRLDTRRSPSEPSVVTAGARPIAEVSRLFIASAAVDRRFPPERRPRGQRTRARWAATAPPASTA